MTCTRAYIVNVTVLIMKLRSQYSQNTNRYDNSLITTITTYLHTKNILYIYIYIYKVFIIYGIYIVIITNIIIIYILTVKYTNTYIHRQT